jgi:transcriptional regulator with XRE-family HTH domain
MRDVQAKQLGRLIATARRKKRWSLRQLQAKTGIPLTWLAELERGEKQRPAPDRLGLVVEVLDMPVKPVDQLLGGPLGAQMTDWRLALRLSTGLTADETQRVEDFVTALVRQREDR